MSTKQDLHTLQMEIEQRFPAELAEKMSGLIENFKRSGIGNRALSFGDTIPDATLTDQNGKQVSIAELLAARPTILSFYRGGWCPYCNLELRAYQDLLGEIRKAGGQLLAITSEKPDHALTTAEKNELDFPVLTDTTNRFAKAIGIAYDFPKELIEIYDGFNLDLSEINDQAGWALAIPATYVVDQAGVIRQANVELDYRTRPEPSEVLEALREINNSQH